MINKANSMCSQGLALHKDMTIAETFNFYGRVLGLAWGSIEDRGLELLKFLNLPDSDKLIGQLRYKVDTSFSQP